MLKLIKTKKYSGLTLIELIVSISIISLVTTIFVVNYQVSTKRTDLIMTAQVVVADIHRAQNNALGLVKYGSEVPAGGWGVHFNMSDRTKYYIFADLQAPGDLGNLVFDINTEGDINQGARIIELPSNLEIAALKRNQAEGLDLDFMNIVFLPPDPRTHIYYNLSEPATSTDMFIFLKDVNDDNPDNYKIVQANILGLVEVLE